MANETFKYPDVTSPTIILTFATAGHLLPDKDIIEFNQLSDVSIGGIRMIKSLGDNFTRFEYTAIVPRSSGSTDLADVKSFVSSTYVNGALQTFVWTDYNSVAKTVRMINNPFTAQRLENSEYYLIRFQLEKT